MSGFAGCFRRENLHRRRFPEMEMLDPINHAHSAAPLYAASTL